MDLPSIKPETLPDPSHEPQFTTNTSQQTICIIGAGPTGLAAIKTILDSDQYKSGKWIPVSFESREDIGGVWLPAPPTTTDPPLTPLYDSLTSNIPHPIMAYTSYPFPPETSLYPHAKVIQKYLNDYTSRFSLRPHIKFNTSVVSVDLCTQGPRRWLIKTSTHESYYFDLIMVCNGHYRVPRYPTVPGLGEWINAHKASHSVYYRHPLQIYKDKTVLIVGAGPSGNDLVSDLKTWARNIISSCTEPPDPINSEGVTFRTQVASYDDSSTGSVTFTDGTVETGIDYCILATGYCQSYPFLSQPVLYNSTPPLAPPIPKDLYNSSYSLFPLAQHIWPLQSLYPPTSIAFLGLLIRVAPFPLVEAQAHAVLRAFDNLQRGVESGGIDERAEAVDIVTRWESLTRSVGEDNVIKSWHRFEPLEQFDYRDRLSIFAEAEPKSLEVGTAGKTWSQELFDDNLNDQEERKKKYNIIRVRDWEREAYLKKNMLRRTWNRLVERGEAELWVKGVGKGGNGEWVDLMRRVLKLGEEEEEGKAKL